MIATSRTGDLLPSTPAPAGAERFPVELSTDSRNCLELFQRERKFISWAIRRTGITGADIDDVVQDVFLALRSSWSKIDPRRSVRAYLFGIVMNVALAHRRRSHRNVPLSLEGELEAWALNPEEALQSVETRRLVWRALDTIPACRRKVLISYELEELRVAEIARALSVPKFTAYSRLRTGRRELKRAVERLLSE